MTQKIIPIGNSEGIIIPRSLREKYNLTKGRRVTVEETSGGIVVKPVQNRAKQMKASPAVTVEFRKWLKGVLKEDAEILDELAGR